MSGYHVNEISKGVFGELSKVQEELDEAWDALEQDCPVMVLVELSDLIGAVAGYLAKHHPSISIGDLEQMALITKRAFESGHRTAQK